MSITNIHQLEILIKHTSIELGSLQKLEKTCAPQFEHESRCRVLCMEDLMKVLVGAQQELMLEDES